MTGQQHRFETSKAIIWACDTLATRNPGCFIRVIKARSEKQLLGNEETADLKGEAFRSLYFEAYWAKYKHAYAEKTKAQAYTDFCARTE